MAIILPKFSRRRSSSGRTESQPAVNVALCRDHGTYAGGETLAVRWQISRIELGKLQAIEVSVLWHTEGKGDEDLHVHHFHRLDENQIRQLGLADEQSISCKLPATPLSYHGRLITVRWCVRLRLFLDDGREILTQQPFHLVARRELIANAVRTTDSIGGEIEISNDSSDQRSHEPIDSASS